MPSYVIEAGTLALGLASLLSIATLLGYFVLLRDVTLPAAALIRILLPLAGAILMFPSVLGKVGLTRALLPTSWAWAPYLSIAVFFITWFCYRGTLSPLDRELEKHLDRLPHNASDEEYTELFAKFEHRKELERKRLQEAAKRDRSQAGPYIRFLQRELRNVRGSRAMFAKHGPAMLPHIDSEVVRLENEIRSFSKSIDTA